MAEEDKRTAVSQPSGDSVSELHKAQSSAADVQHRYRLMRWVVWGSLLSLVLAAGWSAWLFVQVRAWQSVAMLGCSVVASGSLWLAWRRVQQGDWEVAAYWVLSAVWVAYGGLVLLFEGVVFYALGSVVLATIIIGNTVLSHRWAGSLLAMIGFSLLAFFVERVMPVSRYVFPAFSWWRVVVWLSGSLVYLGILIGPVVRSVRITSIRMRLVVASILLVSLPIVIVSVSSVTLGWQEGQRQVLDRLDLAISSRKSRISAWMGDLEAALRDAEENENIMSVGQYILQQYQEVADPTTVKLSPELLAMMTMRLDAALQKDRVFQDILLLDVHGYVVAATDSRWLGRDYASESFFLDGQREFHTSLLLGHPNVLIASLPVFATETSLAGERAVMGVLVGRANLDRLRDIMRDKIGVGETGDIYVVGPDFVALTEMRLGGEGLTVLSPGALAAIQDFDSGYVLYVNERGVPVLEVYEWLPPMGAALIAEQTQSEAFSEILATIRLNLMIALLSMALAMGAVWFITRGIVRPLSALTETVLEIAEGNFERQATVGRMDEVGKLAQTFNRMTAQIRALVINLEERVAERTRDLQRRSRYLEASAEVGRAVSSILDTDKLLVEVVDLILDRFELYYVGLFLIQEESAVLRAGTGAAGAAMLARNHSILIGEGMIGWSIFHNQARIASRAETDAVRVINPELPDTRSEAALPLHSRGQVLGALSVQSASEDAFDEDTITVLQIMADQVAVALDNTRLFAAAQQALEAERRAYGLQAQRAWADLLRSRDIWGYSYSRERVNIAAPTVLTDTEWPSEMQQVRQTGEQLMRTQGDQSRLVLPIRASNQVIGVLSFDKTVEDSGWTDEEVTLLETLTDQLGQTLERAQLYLQTQRRAARERMIATVSSRMRESMDIDAVLQTTVREILGTLDFASVEVRLGSDAPQHSRTGGEG